MRWLLPVLLCWLPLAAIVAQEGQLPAMEFLRERAAELGVLPADLNELTVTDRYPSPDGVEHIYLQQLLHGTPVYNAGAAVHFRGAAVVHHASWLQARLTARVTSTVPSLNLQQAWHDSYPPPGAVLEEGELVYFPLPDSDEIRLCWQLTIDDRAAGTHYLSIIDAVTAYEHYRKALSVSCAFSTGGRRSAGKKTNRQFWATAPPPNRDGAMYNVYPFGLESPLDGDRQLLFEPADTVASPFGWHDTDGRHGPEYTTTRGNNVYAYRDADKEPNEPDPEGTADGGEHLDFDFPFAPGQAPGATVEASLTQLFYNVNALHDWSYAHGFDEAAGNFQQHNYGRGGRAGDPINAEAQDGSSTNNATFYTPRDGKAGRMQMFLWRGRTELLEVRYPALVAGRYASSEADFGPKLTDVPVAAELAIGLDGSDVPLLGCGELINPDRLRGKVVLIERGECPFQLKAYRAEQAGAVAVIISNPANDLITMGGMDDAADYPVTIPVIMLRASDAQPLREALYRAETVRVALADYSRKAIDGSFDNGIVAHEYGHGITNRIVGGPSSVTCLLNDEQMGEGWSDFFLLSTTPRTRHARPTGAEKRSVGTYAIDAAGSQGFRSAFYSTDPAVNGLTYDHVITASVPHGLGEVWAATLWDIYWAMVDRYGFDEDLVHGTGGNNRAVRLVIEALKYTPCAPGLVDGRDALLAADAIGNGGADACLLWSVFQRRGLGYSASQGSGERRNDNREDFTGPPACIASLKITKASDREHVLPGDTVTYTLTVRNDKPTALTDLQITDQLPAGMRLAAGSVAGVTDFGLTDGQLSWDLATLAAGTQASFTYAAVTDPNNYGDRLFTDGAETPTANWNTLSRRGEDGWQRSDYGAFSGQRAWYVPNTGRAQDHELRTAEPLLLSGRAPALRFFTRYDTEPAYDAGVVEISTDDGNSWITLSEDFLRYAYRGAVSQWGADELRGQAAFWGNSDGYREVIIDLSAYRDRRVLFRWRFASDADVGAGGWWVDQVEVLPAVRAYNGMARVTAAEGDRDSSRTSVPGVVIDHPASETVPVAASLPTNRTLTVYPNPTDGPARIRLWTVGGGKVDFRVVDATGREVLHRSLDLPAGWYEIPVDAANWSPGVYHLTLTDAGTRTVVPLTILP